MVVKRYGHRGNATCVATVTSSKAIMTVDKSYIPYEVVSAVVIMWIQFLAEQRKTNAQFRAYVFIKLTLFAICV